MKRSPSIRMVFHGTEVERTAAYGRPTTFFAGKWDWQDIERVSPEGSCIYLAANQSWSVSTTEEWAALLHKCSALFKDRYVSIDVPIASAESFLQMGPYAPNCIIQACLRVLCSQTNQLYLKVDDDVRQVSNPGVWVAPITSIMKDTNFTPWSSYIGDTL